jgi:hypothetical protein
MLNLGRGEVYLFHESNIHPVGSQRLPVAIAGRNYAVARSVINKT